MTEKIMAQLKKLNINDRIRVNYQGYDFWGYVISKDDLQKPLGKLRLEEHHSMYFEELQNVERTWLKMQYLHGCVELYFQDINDIERLQ